MSGRLAGSLFSVFAMVLGFSSQAAAQTRRTDTAGDVSVVYSYMHDSSSKNFNGFRFSVARNLSDSWALVVEAGADRNGSGVYRSSSGTHLYTYTDATVLGGVRLRRVDGSSSTPFFQVLGGYFGRRDGLTTDASFDGHFAVRTEVGVDLRMSDHAAFRFGGGWTFLGGGVRYMNQVGANAGFAYRFGRR